MYDLIKLVEKIHYPQMDLEDGDLCDRIWEYQTYRLQRIPISLVIDRNDYTLDEERWISFEELFHYANYVLEKGAEELLSPIYQELVRLGELKTDE